MVGGEYLLFILLEQLSVYLRWIVMVFCLKFVTRRRQEGVWHFWSSIYSKNYAKCQVIVSFSFISSVDFLLFATFLHQLFDTYTHTTSTHLNQCHKYYFHASVGTSLHNIYFQHMTTTISADYSFKHHLARTCPHMLLKKQTIYMYTYISTQFNSDGLEWSNSWWKRELR